MKQWRINKDDGAILVENVSVRNEGQVKLKLSKVAVSSHDMSNFATLPKTNAVTPGHSAVAFVSEADEDSGLKLGARVVISPYVKVQEHGEDVIFLRKIERGGADKSFGIHVAHLAGLPRPVIMRAHEILARIEANDVNQSSIGQNILQSDADRAPHQVGLFESPAMDLIEELRALDVMAMTPIDALNTLFSLEEKARKI